MSAKQRKRAGLKSVGFNPGQISILHRFSSFEIFILLGANNGSILKFSAVLRLLQKQGRYHITAVEASLPTTIFVRMVFDIGNKSTARFAVESIERVNIVTNHTALYSVLALA